MNSGPLTYLRIDSPSQPIGDQAMVMEADPRVFGRVYIGTNGRGVPRTAPLTAVSANQAQRLCATLRAAVLSALRLPCLSHAGFASAVLASGGAACSPVSIVASRAGRSLITELSL